MLTIAFALNVPDKLKRLHAKAPVACVGPCTSDAICQLKGVPQDPVLPGFRQAKFTPYMPNAVQFSTGH
eukprot:3464013-Amphidinium_carterae.1